MHKSDGIIFVALVAGGQLASTDLFLLGGYGVPDGNGSWNIDGRVENSKTMGQRIRTLDL